MVRRTTLVFIGPATVWGIDTAIRTCAGCVLGLCFAVHLLRELVRSLRQTLASLIHLMLVARLQAPSRLASGRFRDSGTVLPMCSISRSLTALDPIEPSAPARTTGPNRSRRERRERVEDLAF
jgi:hypothetical protein